MCVCLLSERCAFSVPQDLHNLRGTEEAVSPGQGPAGLGEWKRGLSQVAERWVCGSGWQGQRGDLGFRAAQGYRWSPGWLGKC